ncbi:MAG: tRNA (adenosine(37)-N6)-threonylcarbamoyltransferase complex ATPase subunit type 1 TsaE [Aquamicrobium sp.]|nr:tRNA (adenosine(37)-N6)-threonylcarbamoyltransferase complex ATPase subunit type 1 TsaE [Aquamicrobium sp.]
MGERSIELELPDEEASCVLGDDFAAMLRPGDVLALHGDLGMGKTTLARAIIRGLHGDRDLEVPSPTFTLVQAYQARFPVQHFDLYRLTSPDELEELGFEEAMRDGVVLVEWPERAEDRLPGDAITVALSEHGSGRHAHITGPADFMARLDRSLAIRAFLDRSGYAGAARAYLVGDASARAYETISFEQAAPVILMNAPRPPSGPAVRDGKPYAQIAHISESVVPFVAIARALRHKGFCAPEVYASDFERGLLLIENLGSEGVLDAGSQPIGERYLAAAELLAAIHRHEWSPHVDVAPGIGHTIPPFDRDALSIESELLVDWYLPHIAGRPATDAERAAFSQAWGAVFDTLEHCEKSILLRDVHSPNIIWREDRSGSDRIGLIDFQDAMIGPSAYDVASLAMDARVTIPAELENAIVEAYVAARRAQGGFDRQAFEAAYAITAAQRNTKILGIFVRLNVRDGKPGYLKHLPRIRSYVARAIEHPALRPVRDLYAELGIL